MTVWPFFYKMIYLLFLISLLIPSMAQAVYCPAAPLCSYPLVPGQVCSGPEWISYAPTGNTVTITVGASDTGSGAYCDNSPSIVKIHVDTKRINLTLAGGGGRTDCGATSPILFDNHALSTTAVCPVDTDNDGVPDSTDQCPSVAGVSPSGCPAEPVTCSDGIVGQDETGIDCGGSCIASCVETCTPPAEWLDFDGDGHGRCLWEVEADNYGNCPDTTFEYTPGNDAYPAVCSKVLDPHLAAVPLVLDPLTSPWGSSRETTESLAIAKVDNGDGTSTQTTVKTVTDPDGNTSTTTTTTNIDNTTGDVIYEGSATVTNITNANSAWSDDAKLINQSVKALTEEIAVDEVDQQAGAFSISSDSELTDLQTDLEKEFTDIKDSYLANKTTFPVEETITSTISNLMPAPQPCTGFSYTMSTGRQISLSCSSIDKIKQLLGYVFAFLTIVYLYHLVFSEDIVK